MTTAELKQKLIRQINKTDNDELLEELSRVLDRENEPRVYQLSEAQKTIIKEARLQYQNGSILTDDEVNLEIEKWLRE
jgi:hypothetical protein